MGAGAPPDLILGDNYMTVKRFVNASPRQRPSQFNIAGYLITPSMPSIIRFPREQFNSCQIAQKLNNPHPCLRWFLAVFRPRCFYQSPHIVSFNKPMGVLSLGGEQTHFYSAFHCVCARKANRSSFLCFLEP